MNSSTVLCGPFTDTFISYFSRNCKPFSNFFDAYKKPPVMRVALKNDGRTSLRLILEPEKDSSIPSVLHQCAGGGEAGAVYGWNIVLMPPTVLTVAALAPP
ncbi:MAG: hypothetical protein RLZZ480_776 [Candidatus Parcubacteria bacterium]